MFWGDVLNNDGFSCFVECIERKMHQVSWFNMCLFVHVAMFCYADVALYCDLNIKC